MSKRGLWQQIKDAATRLAIQSLEEDVNALQQAPVSAASSGYSVLTDTTHGRRGGELLHLPATTTANGFMSAADKAKLATLSADTVKFTEEGGLAVLMINKTGSDSVKGTIVAASTGTDSAFELAGAGSPKAIGIVYESGIADAANCWVVVSGIAEVLMQDSVATTHGNYALTSASAAGRAVSSSTYPTATVEQGIGHIILSTAGGTNVLTKVILQFR